MCVAGLHLVSLRMTFRPLQGLHAIKGKGLQSLLSTCIEIGAKCGNVTVDTILPSRSTTKRKLDDKCKMVKANLAKEMHKPLLLMD